MWETAWQPAKKGEYPEKPIKYSAIQAPESVPQPEGLYVYTYYVGTNVYYMLSQLNKSYKYEYVSLCNDAFYTTDETSDVILEFNAIFCTFIGT